MILKWLIKNQWKESLRSSFRQKKVAINIIMGIGITYFVFNFLFLGFSAKSLLLEYFPDEDPVIKFNGFLFYFMGMDLLTRFQIQSVPTLSIQPYLHLPVKRSSLMHYLLSKSLTNPINYIYYTIFIPFALNGVAYFYNSNIAIVWLLSLLMISLFDNFLIIYFKRQLGNKPIITLFFGLFMAALFLMDYYKIYSFRNISEVIFTTIMLNKILLLVLIVVVTLLYYLNFSFLKKNSYLEEIGKNDAKKAVHSKDISFIKQFGVIGELINLEIKLILRNKRTRSLAIMSPLFVLYGLFFYTQKANLNLGPMLILAGIFVTGAFLLMYGNYLFSWESSYFDLIISNNIDYKKYFTAKYYLIVSVTGVSYILSMFYIYYGIEIIYFNTVCYLFNIGFNIYIILYFSLSNKKYIDLNRQAAFNYQGLSAKHYITMFPILFLPMILYSIISLCFNRHIALISLGSIGILGILLHNVIINFIVKKFHDKKYEMAEGFRQRS